MLYIALNFLFYADINTAMKVIAKKVNPELRKMFDTSEQVYIFTVIEVINSSLDKEAVSLETFKRVYKKEELNSIITRQELKKEYGVLLLTIVYTLRNNY